MHLVDVAPVTDGAPTWVTGFVLDHALRISDELPAGNPFRTGYAGPPHSLSGRVTDHGVGVQTALAVLAWAGRTGVVTVTSAQAALVTDRYSADIADIEPDTFTARSPRAGVPFGGVLECFDGYVELIIFTPAAWRAVAGWLGGPSWATHPGLPTKAYLDARADQIQTEILAWARTKTTGEVLAAAEGDDVPTARFVDCTEAVTQPHWLKHGYAAK